MGKTGIRPGLFSVASLHWLSRVLYFQSASARTSFFMEHPCENCGHAVKDGIPFCAHCRAPQIRVVVAAPEGAESPSGNDLGLARTPNSIYWSLALPVCAAAGILCGFLMAVTDASALWMIPTSFVTVAAYRRRHAAIRVSGRIGARLGGGAGVVAMAVFFAATVYNGRLPELFAQTLNLYVTLESNPSLKDFAQRSLETLKQPEGFPAWVMSLCIWMFTIFVVGGALAGAFLGRRDRR